MTNVLTSALQRIAHIGLASATLWCFLMFNVSRQFSFNHECAKYLSRIWTSILAKKPLY